jgi:hypothetical protein
MGGTDRMIRRILTVAIYTLLTINICGTKQVVASKQARQEAKQIWEQAIAAKGGREKLISVKNMVISSRAEYVTHRGKRNSWNQEELSVFPDKTWLWSDMRPDVFGLRIEMKNYGSKISYVVSPDAQDNDGIRHLTDDYKWEESGILITQVMYFMETNWAKPLPMVVHRGEVKKQIVDIVQTQVNGKRVDFALDPKTHLPMRIIFYGMLNGAEAPIVVTDLSDYVEVNGIKVPQRATPENGSTFRSKVLINVDYNENIFVKPVMIEVGPEAWKVK